MHEQLVVLHLPAPIGWIGLTQSEICVARDRATELMHLESGSQGLLDGNRRAEAAQLLTPDDAARVLAIDPSWLLTRARENKIPHVRLGKYVRFDPVAIMEFGQRAKDAKP